MPIEMVRIDDRLIHGQVVIGWCSQLKPDRLIVCDDEVAQSQWEREIYEDAAPDYKTSIYTVEETFHVLKGDKLQSEKIILIVPSPGVIVQLLQRGLKFDQVIVGGMHYQSGKEKVLDFIYVDAIDVSHFQFLFDHGVKLIAKDVPSCKPIDLAKKLNLTVKS